MQKSHLYLLKQLQSLGADLKEEDKEFSGQSLTTLSFMQNKRWKCFHQRKRYSNIINYLDKNSHSRQF